MFFTFKFRVVFCVVIALCTLALYYSAPPPAPPVSSLDLEYSDGDHPIQVLTEQAAERWNRMLARQSGTLQQAVKEYKRRYGRSPPKGFDVWYQWATERGLKLVDEFDTINNDLEPFWGLSASQIEARRQEMHKMGRSDRLLTLTIRDGQVGDEMGPASTDKWPSNVMYWKLFQEISRYLPDMNVLINIHDGPVSFVRFEERQRLIDAGRNRVYARDEEEILIGTENTEPFSSQDLALACHPSTPARQTILSPFNRTTYPSSVLAESKQAFQLPDHQGAFVSDQRKQADLCFNPELAEQHGAFLEPNVGLNIVRGRLYPVFSWSRHLASSDISIPTTYGFNFRNEQTRLPWDSLTPKVAWRGACNGMTQRTNLDVLASHRWRLMSLVSSPFRRLPLFTSTSSPPSEIAIEEAEEWFNVGCTHASIKANTQDLALKFSTWFKWAGHMTFEQRDRHKVLLDVDGWGWSSRFRDLMWSNGAVVKTTVFHEVLSDWLVPWYHYIPINYAYTDLASVLYYYFGLPGQEVDGHDKELQRIAAQGQAWVEEHAMWDHHLAYTFRLALEWARITAEDRSTMDLVL